MHYLRLIVIASALSALCPAAVGQTTSGDTINEEHIRNTITAFWKAFGDLDSTGLKASLDWPNIMIQARTRTPTGPGMVNTDAAKFEAEFRQMVESRSAGRKGDFYGTTVDTIEVRFLSKTLAYAYHSCTLGGQAGVKAERLRGNRKFEAMAVVRATGTAAAAWKIVFITVPE